MRLLLATDAWAPPRNGVVVSLRNTLECLRKAGHEVALIEPGVRQHAMSCLALTYPWLQWLHGPFSAVMTATPAMRAELGQWGFRKAAHWGRGVDASLFRPGPRAVQSYPH
jgi:hypothetical protein